MQCPTLFWKNNKVIQIDNELFVVLEYDDVFSYLKFNMVKHTLRRPNPDRSLSTNPFNISFNIIVRIAFAI
jgi:hypothetical protein